MRVFYLINSSIANHYFELYVVSAWAESNNLVLGPLKVGEKSNEITAVPQLLRVFELAGCIVTIDAMGCQKKIAREIIKADADYVLALRENQPPAKRNHRVDPFDCRAAANLEAAGAEGGRFVKMFESDPYDDPYDESCFGDLISSLPTLLWVKLSSAGDLF